MLTTTLLPVLAAALIAATFWFAGLRRGERLGRDQTRSDLDAIARAAADQSNQQARESYERATGQALETLQAATRSDRELERERLASATEPLRQSLENVQRLASDLEQKRARDHGALEAVARQLSSQVDTVVGSARSLREALKGDRQARGRWGEIQLQTLVESVGLLEHSDFATQTGRNGVRPDLVLHLPGGANLAVDSKVPMDDYLAATEITDDPDRQASLFARHAERVRQHIRALSEREYPSSLGKGPPLSRCSSCRSSPCSPRRSATDPNCCSTRRATGSCSPPRTRWWASCGASPRCGAARPAPGTPRRCARPARSSKSASGPSSDTSTRSESIWGRPPRPTTPPSPPRRPA